jgi:hypothetical protein
VTGSGEEEAGRARFLSPSGRLLSAAAWVPLSPSLSLSLSLSLCTSLSQAVRSGGGVHDGPSPNFEQPVAEGMDPATHGGGRRRSDE